MLLSEMRFFFKFKPFQISEKSIYQKQSTYQYYWIFLWGEKAFIQHKAKRCRRNDDASKKA